MRQKIYKIIKFTLQTVQNIRKPFNENNVVRN